MTEEGQGFVNTPEPTTYTAKVKLAIDDSKAIRVVVNETKDVFAGEFSLPHDNVEVTKMEIRPNRDDDYMRVRFGSIINTERFKSIEDRIEDMLVRELGYKRGSTEVTIIDTLP